jgi:protein ImuB
MSSLTPDLFDPTPLPAGQPARLSLVPEASSLPARQVPRELWLCLWLPQLPLDALASGEDARDTAACVVEGEGSAQRVVAASGPAVRHGIRAGLALNAALALWPGVRLHARQPAAEAALLERLARWTTQFTPVVSLEPPHALLAEVRGSLALFGGAAGLRQRVLEGLRSRGLHAVTALAPTPRAALWLARAGLDTLVQAPGELPGLAARLPLSCLGWPQATLARFETLGLRTVADLARLPRDGFARRFGPSLLAELDEAFGRRPQPRRRAVMPERFDDSLELPEETGSIPLLEAALERLLGCLEAFLRVRSAGIHGLAVALLHRGRPATRLRLGLARPSGEAAHLLALLHERLGCTPLPAPVVGLRLRSTVAMPLELRTGALPGTAEHGADPEAAARLLEHLRVRLGREAVFSVRLAAEHRPERAWQVSEPALCQKGPQPFSMPEKGCGPFFPARPLWMIAEPQALRECDGLPRHAGRSLTLLSGPERIETGWWDGQDVCRDYYVAAAADGVRLWIYRERRRSGGWWLHGVFG